MRERLTNPRKNTSIGPREICRARYGHDQPLTMSKSVREHFEDADNLRLEGFHKVQGLHDPKPLLDRVLIKILIREARGQLAHAQTLPP
jgi:hypothetical protein